MAPARTVPALDEVEHRRAGVRLGGEALAIEELALKGREEALAAGVVVGVPTLPIDGRTPASRQRRPKTKEVYWQAKAQRTTRQLHASKTTARDRKPAGPGRRP